MQLLYVLFRYQGKECISNTQSITPIDGYKLTPMNILKQIVNLQNQKEVTEMSIKVAKYSIAILCK